MPLAQRAMPTLTRSVPPCRVIGTAAHPVPLAQHQGFSHFIIHHVRFFLKFCLGGFVFQCASLFLFLLKQDFIASTVSTGKSSFEKTPVSQKRMPVGNGKKQLTTSRKNQNVSGGPSTQRLHPGMSSSHNRATAHYGAVTGLRATSDGMYLLSSG